MLETLGKPILGANKKGRCNFNRTVDLTTAIEPKSWQPSSCNFQPSTISPDEIVDIFHNSPEFKNSDCSVAPRLCRVICNGSMHLWFKSSCCAVDPRRSQMHISD